VEVVKQNVFLVVLPLVQPEQYQRQLAHYRVVNSDELRMMDWSVCGVKSEI